MSNKIHRPDNARDAVKDHQGAQDGANALMAFGSEDASTTSAETPVVSASVPPPRRPTPARAVRGWLLWSFLAVLAAAATTSLVALDPIHIDLARRQAGPGTGRVTFETVPQGAPISIDGEARGMTPLAIRLSPGHHEALVGEGVDARIVPLEVAAGGEILHRIEFAGTPSLSKLSVFADPPGARVSVDGEPHGVAPVTVSDLAPGRHRVTVSGASGTSERFVVTEAGQTASVAFSVGQPAAAPAGWLTVIAPFEVRVVENNEVIGTSAAARIMVPPGNHEFDLVNADLGYQTRRRVDIASGRINTVRLEATAPLNINARPWAEVTVDGTAVGLTPIANYVVPIGRHQVVFRHPQFGEQRQEVIVTVGGPNRTAADFEN